MPRDPPVISATLPLHDLPSDIVRYMELFAASITGPHLASSPAMNVLRSSGEPPAPCMVFCSRKDLPLSLVRKVFTAAFTLLTMSFGVLAGATTAYQAVASKPLYPASCTVGTSGSCMVRWLVVTASARIL